MSNNYNQVCPGHKPGLSSDGGGGGGDDDDDGDDSTNTLYCDCFQV